MSKESVLITALEKIIEMNRQNAEDQYGNADKAERWSCVTVAQEAIKKYNTETKEPFINEEPKDHIPDIGKMIGEDELKEKFKYAITWMGSDLDGKLERCTEIAQQYANSKLDELEKWCDEQFKHADALDKQEDTETRYWGGKKDGISLAKNKISSLKQQ